MKVHVISIRNGFMRYKNLAHDQIRASHWTIWLMNIKMNIIAWHLWMSGVLVLIISDSNVWAKLNTISRRGAVSLPIF